MAIKDLLLWRNKKPDISTADVSDLVHRFKHDMSVLMGDFFNQLPSSRLTENLWPEDSPGPRVDLVENERDITVTAEVPGFEPSDLAVECSDHRLIISGKRQRQEERAEGGVTRRESNTRSFRRVIPLDGDIAPDGIEATYRNGLLTVTLPRTKPPRERRKVSIKT